MPRRVSAAGCVIVRGNPWLPMEPTPMSFANPLVLSGKLASLVPLSQAHHDALIDAVNRRVEIGSTWYRRRVQRSGLNTEVDRVSAPARCETRTR
jgi:hypothetical protein